MRNFFTIVAILFLSVTGFSQSFTDIDFDTTGKAVIKVFSNFHADLSDNDFDNTAFEIKRAYLGYNHSFNGKLSGQVVFDVGLYENTGRYGAFLKIASLSWKPVKNLKINGGMVSPKMFKTQERFWGYRYLYKTFPDEFKFGPSADLGITVDYKFNKYISADFSILNGEGYKNVVLNYGDFKQAFGVTVNPVKGLKLRLYYDMMNNNDTSRTEDQRAVQNTFVTFLGYKFKDKVRIAAEYNYQKQHQNLKDTDLFGYSFYGSFIFSKRIEVFGRVDLLDSNKPEEEVENWNYKKDGTGFLVGLQYKPIKEVKLALNYRNWQYDKPEEAETIIPKSFVYLSLEFVF
jgi:hypothetical protein